MEQKPITQQEKTAKELRAEERQNDYNEGVAVDHHHAPGLCG